MRVPICFGSGFLPSTHDQSCQHEIIFSTKALSFFNDTEKFEVIYCDISKFKEEE